ncbi:MAG: hypothetical protein R2724_20105 [Bryobacterales bacterium]
MFGANEVVVFEVGAVPGAEPPHELNKQDAVCMFDVGVGVVVVVGVVVEAGGVDCGWK